MFERRRPAIVMGFRASDISAHQFSAVVTRAFGPLHVAFELEAAGDHYVTLFDPVSAASRAYRLGGVTKSDVAEAIGIPIRPAGIRLFGTAENMFDRNYFVQGFGTSAQGAPPAPGWR